MFLRSILLLCFGLLLNGCYGPAAAGILIGGLAGPVTCAKKVIEDKDAKSTDYLKIPAALVFGPFVGIWREGETRTIGTKTVDRIKYMADVCDTRSKEEYFKDLRKQKEKDSKEEEEKK